MKLSRDHMLMLRDVAPQPFRTLVSTGRADDPCDACGQVASVARNPSGTMAFHETPNGERCKGNSVFVDGTGNLIPAYDYNLVRRERTLYFVLGSEACFWPNEQAAPLRNHVERFAAAIASKEGLRRVVIMDGHPDAQSSEILLAFDIVPEREIHGR